MCDHTYCYTPAVQRIRQADRSGRDRRRPVHRFGPDQPWSRAADVNVLGISRRMTSRSSISCCPRTWAGGSCRAHRRSARDPAGLPRVPVTVAIEWCSRPYSRELGKPDQGADTVIRRLTAHHCMGRHQPGSEDGQSTTAETRCRRVPCLDERRQALISYRPGTRSYPRCPSGRLSGRHDRIRQRDQRGPITRLPTLMRACESLACSKPRRGVPTVVARGYSWTAPQIGLLSLSKRIQPFLKFLDSSSKSEYRRPSVCLLDVMTADAGNVSPSSVHGHFVDPQHAVTGQHVNISVGSRPPHYPPRNAADVATSVPHSRRAHDRDAACDKITMCTWIRPG